MEQLFDKYVNIVDGVKINTLVILLMANLATGVLVAFKTHTFTVKEFGKFVGDKVPYMLGYLTIGLVALVDDSWKAIVTVAFAGVTARYLGYIAQNFRELGWGDWIPDLLVGKK